MAGTEAIQKFLTGKKIFFTELSKTMGISSGRKGGRGIPARGIILAAAQSKEYAWHDHRKEMER